MKPLKENEILPEVKRRIRALLKESTASEVYADYKSDLVLINYTHSIHFTLKNKDYALTGTIMKKIK